MPIVLYTKVDAQYDKMATVVGQTKFTTLATVDVLQNFTKSRVWEKVPDRSTLIFGETQIPL